MTNEIEKNLKNLTEEDIPAALEHARTFLAATKLYFGKD